MAELCHSVFFKLFFSRSPFDWIKECHPVVNMITYKPKYLYTKTLRNDLLFELSVLFNYCTVLIIENSLTSYLLSVQYVKPARDLLVNRHKSHRRIHIFFLRWIGWGQWSFCNFILYLVNFFDPNYVMILIKLFLTCLTINSNYIFYLNQDKLT